jgi:ATP-dependent protease HslVU (ClpYQ) peptidase subunit
VSIIAALWFGNGRGTWIGSDTAVCSDSIRQAFGPKWAVRPPWAIGVAGHLRAANVLFRGADGLLQGLADPHEFALRVRAHLQADGFRDAAAERGPLDLSQIVMLAHPDGVWSIGADFSVLPVPAGTLWAEGSGREVALGAGHALLQAGFGADGGEVLRRALEAAIALDITCGGEAWVCALAAPAQSGRGGAPGQGAKLRR